MPLTCASDHEMTGKDRGPMERMPTQTMPSRKTYAAPRLKLYGSVQALTAAGTGMMNEMSQSGTMNNCNLGQLGIWPTRKHCN